MPGTKLTAVNCRQCKSASSLPKSIFLSLGVGYLIPGVLHSLSAKPEAGLLPFFRLIIFRSVAYPQKSLPLKIAFPCDRSLLKDDHIDTGPPPNWGLTQIDSCQRHLLCSTEHWSSNSQSKHKNRSRRKTLIAQLPVIFVLTVVAYFLFNHGIPP
jgi:hypothetical protein